MHLTINYFKIFTIINYLILNIKIYNLLNYKLLNVYNLLMFIIIKSL